MISNIISGFILASLLATPAQAGDLKLTVMGVRSDAGQLMIGLYVGTRVGRKAPRKAGKIWAAVNFCRRKPRENDLLAEGKGPGSNVLRVVWRTFEGLA